MDHSHRRRRNPDQMHKKCFQQNHRRKSPKFKKRDVYQGTSSLWHTAQRGSAKKLLVLYNSQNANLCETNKDIKT